MIAYHFGQLSLAGFLSNPLIVPLVGFVIVPLGLLIGFLSLLAPILTLPLLWLTDSLLVMTLETVRLLAGLPWANIATPSPNLAEITVLYGLLCSLFAVRRKMHLYIVCSAVAVTALASGYYWHEQRRNRSDLRVTFLNVGHGDAAVVEFPRSKVLLIDAGGAASEEFDPGESIIAPFLRSRRIGKVDYLLVSHPRVDHYGGMKTIVEQFSPSEFWHGFDEGRTSRYRELQEAVSAKGAKRTSVNSRDPCRVIEGVNVCVLYSADGKTGGSSVVTRLSFGRVSFLFAADIEKKEEGSILKGKKDFESQVLKVPRHGSLSSSTGEFIAAVKPRLAVFSVGHRNPFGLPREEVISRYRAVGSEILRTDEDGAIVIETDGETIRYRTYRSQREGMLSP
jgi:competence protein ComEC